MTTDSATSVSARLTSEQHAALHTREVAVALSAGAGCGKTFVLIQRYLAQLFPTKQGSADSAVRGGAGSTLQELLAITFTTAAAREMRERVRHETRKRIQAKDTSADWHAILRQLDQARISTIDSLCASILRQHAAEAGLDPGFRVLTESEVFTLQYQAVEATLRRSLERLDRPALNLLSQMSLEELSGKLRDLVGSSEWMDWPFAQFRADQMVEHWLQGLHEKVLPHRIQQVQSHPAVAQLLQLVQQFQPTNARLKSRFAVLIKELPQLGDLEGIWERCEQIRENATTQHAHQAAHWPDDAFKTDFSAACKDLKEALAPLQGLAPPEPAVLLAHAERVQDFLHLARDAHTGYEQTKSALSGLDFADLLAKTVRLLSAPEQRELADRFARQIQLLLVDEFQDTSQTQVELISALCSRNLKSEKLFLVGDQKQSIYRFRGAKPRVFQELVRQLPATSQLKLSRNFRSQAGVLEFVNALFAGTFPDESLVPHHSTLASQPVVEFLFAQPDAERTEHSAGGSSANTTQGANATNPAAEPNLGVEHRRRAEARWMVGRIQQLLYDDPPCVRDKRTGQLRPAQLGDICLLFRALTDVEIYEQALAHAGLDYYLEGGHSFYARQEVYDLLHLLTVADDPLDQVALLGLLRGPFGGLDDETIFELTQGCGGFGNFFGESVAKWVSKPEQAAQAERVMQWIQELRRRKDRQSVSELLVWALETSGYDAAVLAEFMGERKHANLEKLIEQTRVAESLPGGGLRSVCLELRERTARHPKEAPATALSPEDQVIRLMTCHKAKGLEFPIVFVVDLFAKTHEQSDPVLISETLGISTTWEQTAPAAKWLNHMERQLESEESRQEALRLFYVATTRAADKLILSGCPKDLTDLANPAAELLAERFDLATGRLLTPLADLPAPQVTVIQAEPVPRQSPKARERRWRTARAVELFRTSSEPEPAGLPAHVGAIQELSLPADELSFSALAPYLNAAESLGDGGEEDDAELPRWRASTQFVEPWAWTVEEEVRPVADDPTLLGKLVHSALSIFPWRDPAIADRRAVVMETLLKQQPAWNRASSSDCKQALRLALAMLQTPLPEEFAQARELYFELEWLLPWRPEGAELLPLHGFIDCLYQTASGAWHLLDFKTNRLKPGYLSELVAYYEPQLQLYCAAVERSMNVQPACSLVFLDGPTLHALPAWNNVWQQLEPRLVNALRSAKQARSQTSAGP